MYGLSEIVAMNTFYGDCHKQRVSSDTLSVCNCFETFKTGGYIDDTPRPITHGEWEAKQQKEREHKSASNTNNQHKGE